MNKDTGIRVVVEDGVLTVTIDREAQLNALSLKILGDIKRVFAEHKSDDNILAAVITATGSRCFAAGGDLRELDACREPSAANTMIVDACAALDAIRQFPTPVIAALNGDALGGGAELALACDMRIFAPHARIAYLQGRLNILPSWGGFSDLAEVVGMSTALALLTSNRFVGAEESLRLGLAQYIAPEDQPFDEFVEQCLQPIREKPGHLVRAMKKFKLEKSIQEQSNKSATRALENALSSEMWLHQAHWDAADKLIQAMDNKKQPA